MASQEQQQQQQPTTTEIQQYREWVNDSQNIRTKISELETDKNEHMLVEETLKPLDPQRRAYRLVGECLVERTIEQVLPSVIENRMNMEKTIIALRERLDEQEKQIVEFKTKYNIQEG